MTKDRLVRFAQANAYQDGQRGIVKTESELTQAIEGYSALASRFLDTTTAVRPGSAQAAFAAYKATRGVLVMAPTGQSRRRARIRLVRSTTPKSVAWSGSLLKRASRRLRKAA